MHSFFINFLKFFKFYFILFLWITPGDNLYAQGTKWKSELLFCMRGKRLTYAIFGFQLEGKERQYQKEIKNYQSDPSKVGFRSKKYL